MRWCWSHSSGASGKSLNWPFSDRTHVNKWLTSDQQAERSQWPNVLVSWVLKTAIVGYRRRRSLKAQKNNIFTMFSGLFSTTLPTLQDTPPPMRTRGNSRWLPSFHRRGAVSVRFRQSSWTPTVLTNSERSVSTVSDSAGGPCGRPVREACVNPAPPRSVTSSPSPSPDPAAAAAAAAVPRRTRRISRKPEFKQNPEQPWPKTPA